jgi:hypothetical protein
MKYPKLLDFIEMYSAAAIPKSSYVKESGFKNLYVRIGPRYYGEYNIWYSALDIANVAVRREGQGTFTRFIGALQERHPMLGLYVENVMTQRFAKMLVERLGFIESESNMGCYWLITEATRVIPRETVCCPVLPIAAQLPIELEVLNVIEAH